MANNSEHSNHPHTVPDKIFWGIFGLLMLLTFITVGAAQFNFAQIIGPEWGLLNIIIAMLIASFKASLVVLFFMHLKYENPLTWIYAFFPIFLLFLLIGGVFLDNPFR